MSAHAQGRLVQRSGRLGINRWTRLESHSDEPEAQEEIRRAISAGLIRVMPGVGDKIRIIPLDGMQPVHRPHGAD